jgi:hypothetical protein
MVNALTASCEWSTHFWSGDVDDGKARSDLPVGRPKGANLMRMLCLTCLHQLRKSGLQLWR